MAYRSKAAGNVTPGSDIGRHLSVSVSCESDLTLGMGSSKLDRESSGKHGIL